MNVKAKDKLVQLSTAFLFFASLILCLSAREAPRPNIILIMSDDMGFSDLGCYGSEIRTPALDDLAAHGLRFTQFYNTARCCPTRASLLTGLYPQEAAVGHMMRDSGLPGFRGDLSRNAVTIAEVMKSAGYSTYMVGKWHVTRFMRPDGPKDNWPLQRGFDRFYGTITGAGSYYDPGTLVRDNTMISPFADPEYRPERFYYTDAISDNAIRFIDEHAKRKGRRPFFMYVAYTAAHWPMHAPEKDVGSYRGVYDKGYGPVRRARFQRLKRLGIVDPTWPLSPQAGDWEKVENKKWEARCMEVYAAMVTRMDEGVGRIVEELKKKGLFENTLIFFLQDNGGCAEGVGRKGTRKRPEKPTFKPISPEAIQLSGHPRQTRDGYPVLGGRGVMPGPADTFIAYGKGWANVSNTPFREYKHWVHEGGISTPLIVHWPARVKRHGILVHDPGHIIDIMATCVDVAGARYPTHYAGFPIKPLEGKSLVPLFEGKPFDVRPIFWEHEGNRAVRVGRWKLVAKGPGGPWELYDMVLDRTELNDLASEYPEKVARLKALWESWALRARALPWPWKPPYRKVKETELEGGAKKAFDLLPGADLLPAESPPVAGRGFTITASFPGPIADGVIVSQGGTEFGYSLYVKGGKLAFALREKGKLSVVESDRPVPGGPVQVGATLKRDGTVELTIRGKKAGRGRVPGVLSTLPRDGLQVCFDGDGAVGPYESPFKLRVPVRIVHIEITE